MKVVLIIFCKKCRRVKKIRDWEEMTSEETSRLAHVKVIFRPATCPDCEAKNVS